MKTALLLLVLSLSLAACSSTQNVGDERASAVNYQSRYDVEWMQRYETVARRGGVRVYWVNLPRQ